MSELDGFRIGNMPRVVAAALPLAAVVAFGFSKSANQASADSGLPVTPNSGLDFKTCLPALVGDGTNVETSSLAAGTKANFTFGSGTSMLEATLQPPVRPLEQRSRDASTASSTVTFSEFCSQNTSPSLGLQLIKNTGRHRAPNVPATDIKVVSNSASLTGYGAKPALSLRLPKGEVITDQAVRDGVYGIRQTPIIQPVPGSSTGDASMKASYDTWIEASQVSEPKSTVPTRLRSRRFLRGCDVRLEVNPHKIGSSEKTKAGSIVVAKGPTNNSTRVSFEMERKAGFEALDGTYKVGKSKPKNSQLKPSVLRRESGSGNIVGSLVVDNGDRVGGLAKLAILGDC